MRIFISLIILLLGLTHQAFASEIYDLDPTHTYVIWHVSHYGFSNLSGKLMASGTLTLNEKDLRNSEVNVTIDTNTLSTDIPELDKILKGDKFFEVEHYPTATFTSRRVQVLSGNAANVYGILTLHGISRPVVLNVRLNKRALHPFFGRMAIGFTGRTIIHRSDFGLTHFLPSIGDIVTIDIQVEGLTKPSHSRISNQ